MTTFFEAPNPSSCRWMTTFLEGPNPSSWRWMITFFEATPGSPDLVMTLVVAPSPISAKATLEIIATAPATVSTYLSIFFSARYDVLLTTGGFAGFPLILHAVPLFRHEHRALIADEDSSVGFATD